MPVNPRSDTITLLRKATTQILESYNNAKKLRQRAEILTGGQGFVAADFDPPGSPNSVNSDLTPADYTGLKAAYDALEAALVDSTGLPTPALVALTRFSNNPTV